MLKLIIKLCVIIFFLYFFYTNPMKIPCFCETGSFIKCIENTKLDTCNDITKNIESIEESFKSISNNISSASIILSEEIPKIDTNIPKLEDIVSEKYTNFLINSAPEIPEINESCPINIPMSKISNESNKAIITINNQINEFKKQINNSQFLDGLNSVILQINNIKNVIDNANIGKRFNVNIIMSCISNYELNGKICVKTPALPYKVKQGDTTNYWNTMPDSYPMGAGIMPDQDNSACDSLNNVIRGVGSCTGWDSCNSKTPVVTTKLCKSCTYDIYSPGCNGNICGYNPEVCVGGDCIAWRNVNCRTSCRSCGLRCGCGLATYCDSECANRSARTCSRTSKCCDNGLKTTLTGINCDKCGTYDSTTGGDCVGAAVTRNAPRTCKSNREFDDLKSLCYPKCNDGYVKKPGDVVSCWNKDPIIKPITDTLIPLLTNSTFQYS